jgi:hypothetical protein
MANLEKLQADPKVTIISVLTGVQAFYIARDMLFVKKDEWEDPNESNIWEANFSEADKQSATFVLFSKKMTVNSKIGIRLFINNILSFGELRPEKEAIKRWKDFI